jgi:serine O-acetyltransferase
VDSDLRSKDIFACVGADCFRLRGQASIKAMLSVFIRDPGFRLLMLFRLSKHRSMWGSFYYILFRVLSERRGIIIPRGVNIGPGCNLGHALNIVINQNSVIGANCNFSQNITLGSLSESAPTIGDNTYLGPNAVISGGVVLGSHTVVGAGSVVLKSFGGSSLVAGSPAAELKPMVVDDVNQILRNVQ